jgi:uncharacterized protein YndB with AHSA1/START domain
MDAALKATDAVVVRRTIAASPEELFDAWLATGCRKGRVVSCVICG